MRIINEHVHLICVLFNKIEYVTQHICDYSPLSHCDVVVYGKLLNELLRNAPVSLLQGVLQ